MTRDEWRGLMSQPILESEKAYLETLDWRFHPEKDDCIYLCDDYQHEDYEVTEIDSVFGIRKLLVSEYFPYFYNRLGGKSKLVLEEILRDRPASSWDWESLAEEEFL